VTAVDIDGSESDPSLVVMAIPAAFVVAGNEPTPYGKELDLNVPALLSSEFFVLCPCGTAVATTVSIPH
jgi:hypothetical protein